MKLAKRDIKRRLTQDEAEAELTRFTYYSSERHSRLDGRAKEAWELGHNSRDNTGTQYTQEQVRMMEQVGAPVVSHGTPKSVPLLRCFCDEEIGL